MKNTAVYVSNLPPNTAAADLHRLMSKAGIIMDNMLTGEPRIKMYGDRDALVVYLREESVDLAVALLDETDYCGFSIRVEPARFDSTATGTAAPDTATTPTSNTHKVDRETWRRKMEKMTGKLEWKDEQFEAVKSVERRLKYECTCLLYNMVTAAEIEADAGLLLDVESDVREEAGKLGPVRSVNVLPSMSLVAVRFESRQSAVLCQKVMNDRFYDGRKIRSALYDGTFKLRDPQLAHGEPVYDDFMPSGSDGDCNSIGDGIGDGNSIGIGDGMIE